MYIINPLYDTAFKELIRDHEVAKTIIGTLIGTEVVDISMNISEFNLPNRPEDKLPRSVRLDYCATILDEKGKYQKVLIEMQKTSNLDDIYRFRQYISVAGYGDKERIGDPIPVVTIYFLGFILENVPTPCLKVARQYICMLENKVLKTKEKFVESLTHDAYVIQVPRIQKYESLDSKLETILSVFDQTEKVDLSGFSGLNYKHPVQDGFHKRMIDILSQIAVDPDKREDLQMELNLYEYEYFRSGRMMSLENEIDKKENELAEANYLLSKNARELTKVTDDLTKVSSEYAKVSSEYTKVSSEYTKVSSEYTKVSNEYSKVSNELTKVSSDYTKVSNELKEKDHELKEKDHELKEKDHELKEKDHELKEKDQKFRDTAIELKKEGFSLERISKLTGLSIQEIEDL